MSAYISYNYDDFLTQWVEQFERMARAACPLADNKMVEAARQLDEMAKTSEAAHKAMQAVIGHIPSVIVPEWLLSTGSPLSSSRPLPEDHQNVAPPKPERAPARNRQLYDQIYQFENRLRDFLQARLVEAFGEDWPNKILDSKTRRDWQFRKRNSSEGDLPLIHYASFSDYSKVIAHNQAWPIFSEIFDETIHTSLLRLNAARIEAAHCRPVTARLFRKARLEMEEVCRAMKAFEGRRNG